GLAQGGGSCQSGGSSSASNCIGSGGWAKTMPGVICTMTVGNNDPLSAYTNKIRNCTEASGRLDGIKGSGCDVINVIELNSDAQCQCACNPKNKQNCDTDPDLGSQICRDDPERPAECKNDGFGYYEKDRCDLCHKCQPYNPATPDGSCWKQVEIWCDPNLYETSCYQVGDKGCDCTCVR